MLLLPPAPLPQGGRGEPCADPCGVLKRQLQRWAEAEHIPLARVRERGTQLKGVGFLLVCMPVKLPSKAFLLPCEQDARAPSTRCAGNAGVPPAIPTTREKTYPLKLLTSPVDGGGAATPSPPAGRAGVGVRC